MSVPVPRVKFRVSVPSEPGVTPNTHRTFDDRRSARAVAKTLSRAFLYRIHPLTNKAQLDAVYQDGERIL